jgi:uroporphyrinogen-III synthase
MMRVLITRPREEAKALALRLEPLGFEPVIDPMIAVRFLADATVDVTDAQAIVFTSTNGVRALKTARGGNSLPRTLPVFAVGGTTAAAARAAGFHEIIEGEGSIEGLARLIVARCPPSAGTVVHISGSVVARDLVPMLAPSGLRVTRAVLYESVQATTLRPETRAGFAAGEIAAALFFSPRTAQAFVKLADDAGLAASMGTVVAIALSPAVADTLRLPFARLVTAARPTTDALLERLADIGRSERSESLRQ